VRAITDLGGIVVNAYAYDAYGNAEEAIEGLAQRFRYTGREWDDFAKLYHYRARAYSSPEGRFLQEDPIGFDAGDLNKYRYAGNNPVNWNDPSGKNASQYGNIGARTGSASTRVYDVGRKVACAFDTIAGVLSVVGAPGVETIELFTDADFGCGAKGSAKAVFEQNIKNGKQAEDIIKRWIANIPAFDCGEEKIKRRRKAGDLGYRVIDAVICFNDEKVDIEIKYGDAPYEGTLQALKDGVIRQTTEFKKTLVVRLKSYKELFGE
jgi:RHS repeat-associated protein